MSKVRVAFNGMGRIGKNVMRVIVEKFNDEIEIVAGKENLKPASTVEQNTIESIKQNYIRLHGEESLAGREIRLSCRARVLGDVKFKSFE